MTVEEEIKVEKENSIDKNINAPKEQKKNISIVEFKNTCFESRKKILDNYHYLIQNKVPKGIEACYELLDYNRKIYKDFSEKTHSSKNPINLIDQESFKKFIYSLEHLEYYLGNMFLLIYGYLKSK